MGENYRSLSEQIHLNFPTQYSFNKWFALQERCPLCSQVPQNIFHVIYDCPFTIALWQDITPFLQKIDPTPVTDTEKAFGILSNTPQATLRNWLTYILRELIESQEKRAYYKRDVAHNMNDFKARYNSKVGMLVFQSYRSYHRTGNSDVFDKYFLIGGVLATETDDEKIQVNLPFVIA